MARSVRHGTVAALNSSGESKFYKSVISLSYRHSKFSVSGRPNCDSGRMLCGKSAVLDGIEQIGVLLFQKRTSDMYLPEPSDFFVCSSSLDVRVYFSFY